MTVTRRCACALIRKSTFEISSSREGRLAISTPAGGFTDETPIAYQEIDGRRVPVEASYVLDEPASSTLDSQASTLPVRGYHFRLGAYDHGRPLILDPVVAVYGGYFGGSGDDIESGRLESDAHV